MDKMTILFSGSLTINSDSVLFVNPDDGSKIRGTDWLDLNDEDRQEYVLEDIIRLMIDSDDLDWEEIGVIDDEQT